jgi:hypothetical protein
MNNSKISIKLKIEGILTIISGALGALGTIVYWNQIYTHPIQHP